jgi:hypothetical protein
VPEEAALKELIERDRIAQVVNALFVSTDARDWGRVRECFASRVSFDMTSLAGGTPQSMTPDEIVAGWRAGLEPIEQVHHQWGNLAIACDGSEATASCYGIAYHYRRTATGRNTRMFVGSYEFHLARDGRWRIDLFRFKLKFVDGNPELEKEPGA